MRKTSSSADGSTAPGLRCRTPARRELHEGSGARALLPLRARLPAAALATLFCFGCATVRVPVSSAAEPADAPGTVAPPLLELWLESSETVRPAERDDAERQARAAIDAALARHQVAPGALGAADAVLFARERAVALTSARRSQQTWAKVGIVAGIVVVVAVVVIAAVAGKDSKKVTGAKSSTAAPARAAPAASGGPRAAAASGGPRAAAAGPAGSGGPRAAAAGPAGSGGPRAAAAGPAASGGPRAGPVGGAGGPIAHPLAPRPLPPPRAYVYGYAPAPLFFDLQFYYAPRPLVLRSEEPADQPYPGAPLPPEPEDADEPAPPDLVSRGSGAAPPAAPLTLPPLAAEADFAVEDRGYFSSAQTALQLDLLDRETGAVLWSKAVASDADPLNAGEVAALVDGALADAAWAPRSR